MLGAVSSHSSNFVEVFPTADESSNSVDLEQLVRELSQTSSEHVLPSSDRGIYIPELGKRICTINQLTRQQRASLTKDQLLQVLSFMANFLSALESSLAHRPGQLQRRTILCPTIVRPIHWEPSKIQLQRCIMHQQDLANQHSRPGVASLKHMRSRDAHEDAEHERKKGTQFVEEKTLLGLFRSLRWIYINLG